jgi:adenosylcobinamide-phosphate guanylyltransferase
MCGGKGTRLKETLGFNTEKPLIKLKNKPLIEYVIDALIQSKKFKGIFAAVSSNAPKTSEFIELNYGARVALLHTLGREYSEDYLKVIGYFKGMENERKLDAKRILFLPIDLPLISLEMLAQLITMNQAKPCLTVILDRGFVKDIGIMPTSYEIVIDSTDYCYSGISIIDITKVDVEANSAGKFNLIEEEFKILNRVELACNTNTLEDLRIAEKFLNSL